MKKERVNIDEKRAIREKIAATLQSNLSFESALTYADWDINRNWLQYKMEFLKGVSNE